MTVNGPAMGHIGTLLHSGLASVIENAPAANLLSYPHRSAEEQLGDSVADWLSDQGIPLDRHRAIFCAGAHNGLFVVLSALLKKGHRLFVDENTYPGIFAIAQHLGLELTPVRGDREGMQIYLGSLYINDFNLFGRTYQVIAQADKPFRSTPESIGQLKTRNANGQMVPLDSVVSVSETFGPDTAMRYNVFRSADLNGNAAPGFSSGEAQAAITKILEETLPPGM